MLDFGRFVNYFMKCLINYMNYMYSGFIYERKKYIVSEGKKVCVRSKLNCFLNLIIVVVFIRNICYRFNRGEFYYWFCNSFIIEFFIWKIRVWIFKGDVYLFLIIFFLLRYFIFVYLVCITMYVFGCFFFNNIWWKDYFKL